MREKLAPYHIVDLAPPRRDTPNLLDVYWSASSSRPTGGVRS
jgi:hypothetical protein